HDAHRAFGQPDESGVAAAQLVLRARDHVADVGQLARRRRRVQALAGIVVLAIVDRGYALRTAAELGMRGDVVDLLAVDPDLPPGLAQTVEELCSGPRAHL